MFFELRCLKKYLHSLQMGGWFLLPFASHIMHSVAAEVEQFIDQVQNNLILRSLLKMGVQREGAAGGNQPFCVMAGRLRPGLSEIWKTDEGPDSPPHRHNRHDIRILNCQGKNRLCLEEPSGAFSHAPKMNRSGWPYRKVPDGINISKYNGISGH
jgi:hypothetical protein